MTEEDNTGCQVNNKDPGASELSTSGVESRNLVTPLEQESMFDMDEQDDESDALDTSDPRDSAASPEDNDEEFGENESVSKKCTYSGCTETTTQVAKARKPWMCKKHRNKMYKDKYKKKKNDQAMTSGKLDESGEDRPVSVTKQRLGPMGDRPARPSLIEQVLNQKRLSLLRSPEVISFLQQQQRLLTSQASTKTQSDY
ncbi:regulatory factor X-associated protein [Clupea harengus]|uniref:Regulatory factor X-associated protein n=1 Tax=Clupea harengus TaxID=7950 RepID=A0A6P3VQV5_CLUHA|nr:regulatory factor X-associated protein [Clupea harengus]